jgi:hypothetical protein
MSRMASFLFWASSHRSLLCSPYRATVICTGLQTTILYTLERVKIIHEEANHVPS